MHLPHIWQSRSARGMPCHRPVSISMGRSPSRVIASKRAWNLLSTYAKYGAPGHLVRFVSQAASSAARCWSSVTHVSRRVLDRHCPKRRSYSSRQSVWLTMRRNVSLLIARSAAAEYPLTFAMCSTSSSVHLHQLYCDLFVICPSSSLCSWACFSSSCINVDSVRPSLHQNIKRARFALDSIPIHPSSSSAPTLSAGWSQAQDLFCHLYLSLLCSRENGCTRATSELRAIQYACFCRCITDRCNDAYRWSSSFS